MLRNAIAAWMGLLLLAAHVDAQDWAVKMFDTTSHDFGTLAKGAKAEFRFQVKNIYEEDAHILGVRSSCGCTTPQITRPDIKTYETSEIVAEFNTRDFQGQKSATLTVTFDKPFPAEMQLHITGFIRRDVVLQPGAIDWGTVDLGTTLEKKLQVSHAGREDWQIVDAKTADPHFEVEIRDLARGGGRVSYELLVRLKPDMPVGYVKDQLILVTNDAQARELPVDMEGRVVPDVTLNPSKLFLGAVQPGQKVSKNLVVRGKKPFKILEIVSDDASFSSFTIDPPKQAKTVHLIPIVFTAGETPGRIAPKFTVHTDLGQSAALTFTAFAEVTGPSEPARATSVESAKPATWVPASKPRGERRPQPGNSAP